MSPGPPGNLPPSLLRELDARLFPTSCEEQIHFPCVLEQGLRPDATLAAKGLSQAGPQQELGDRWILPSPLPTQDHSLLMPSVLVMSPLHKAS